MIGFAGKAIIFGRLQIKKHYIDEKTAITYTLQGNYYLSNLVLPTEKETRSIGLWGQRHLHYLKEYHRITYANLLISSKLNSYLADIDEQAKEMFSLILHN